MFNLNFRENLNTKTHLVGVLFSSIATFWMLIVGIIHLSWQSILGGLIFGISSIALYSASSYYHAFNGTKEQILKLKKLDHMMIFVLISGTYTPICLKSLPLFTGIILLICVWSITILGIFFKLFWINAPRWLYTSLYVLLGWACLFVMPDLLKYVNHIALTWLALGGVSYTIGAVIYALKSPKLEFGEFRFHEIFHIFVLIGSICQFICIDFYVL